MARSTAGRGLSHVDARGRVKMVDVAGKPVTAREAVARGSIAMSQEALRLIRRGAVKKGDPLQTARLAGILAAKQTSALIPLCHPLPLSSVEVDLTPTARGYAIEARVRTREREIATLGAEKSRLEKLMAAPDMYGDNRKDDLKRCLAEQADVTRKLQKAEEEWLILGAELEALTADDRALT